MADDLFWNNVQLLLGFEGSDASTTITDESPQARGTATVNGNAQIDTAQKKTGASSLLLDGTGDSISYPDSSDFDLGAGDFTIEASVRFNATSFGFVVGQWQSGGNLGWVMSCDNNGLYLNVSDDGSNNIGMTGSQSLTTGTWYDFCVDYDGAKYRIYIDGVMVGSDSTPRTLFNSGNTLSIGSNDSHNAFFLNGWIDELRITKGVARYASDGGYTPEAGAFPRTGVPAGSVVVSWANRNRLTEDSQPLAWDDASVAPESGQTTNVYLLNPDRSVAASHTALSGTSYTLDLGPLGANPYGFIKVTSSRDGLESIQGYEVTVQVDTVPAVSLDSDGSITASIVVFNSYLEEFTISDGLGPYRVSYTGTLPPGMELRRNESLETLYQLTGNPTIAGNYTGITITVTDAVGDTDSVGPFDIEVTNS